VRSTPHNVVVREEYWGSIFEAVRPRTQATVLGHQKVKNDLLISGPVPRIREDEDGFNLYLAEVACTRVLILLVGQLTERSRVLIVLDDVSGCNADTVVS
jgi:hypothetical protein